MKSCAYCGSEQHTDFQCFNRPRKPLKNKKLINRVGAVTAKWIDTRHRWIETHITKEGFWTCYICGSKLTIEATETTGMLTLDHIKSRTRHPELRFELTNLAPCCAPCNAAKGSLSLEEYLERKEEYVRYKSGCA